MAPVARGLADSFRVIEPFQRGSDAGPLTVARHVEDLWELIDGSAGTRPALVGSSWGAMLALAYAAAHPQSAGPLVLIGCGTFDPQARCEYRARRERRTGADLARQLTQLPAHIADPDARLKAEAHLLLTPYSYDLVSTDLEIEECDATASQQTWDDMVRLQEAGIYPAAFARIRAPVLMLHGAVDPHPGMLIRAGLAPHLPQLQYIEWERCGHYPWLERWARDEFIAVLRRWLLAAVHGPTI
jgi:pimeloyl-ACP methyl ester carboxylesterase